MNLENVMPMRETMDKLAATAAVLNKESDELNAVIDDFEEQLEAAGVGISVWLADDCLLNQSDWTEERNPHDEHGEYAKFDCTAHALGYAKVEGKWRVAVKPVKVRRYAKTSEWEDWEWYAEGPEIPLAKAPRAIRVEAAQHLEGLAEALTLKMKLHIESIAKAKKAVRE